MSGDPKRWLDDGGDATDAERDLLRSADDVDPPERAHAAVWSALATRLPPPPGGGSGPGPGAGGGGGGSAIATKTILGSPIAKIVGGLALVGVVGATIVAATRPRAATPSVSVGTGAETSNPVASAVAIEPPASTASSAPIEARALTTATEPPLTLASSAPSSAGHPLARHAGAKTSARATADAPAATTTAVASPAPAKADALREESALIAAARDALRRGDTRTALASAEAARTRFPNGTLAQEREVIVIEALAQSGDTDGASRRANAFLQTFPQSPHAARVRSFVR